MDWSPLDFFLTFSAAGFGVAVFVLAFGAAAGVVGFVATRGEQRGWW